MSYNNFIPSVYSAEIERARERMNVAIALCNRDYEGEIKEAGDRVKINGVFRPTVGTYVKNSTTITPENKNSTGIFLDITQSDYFAFEVDDIDKRQTKGDLMTAEMAEAAAAMSETADSFVYGLYGDAATTIDCANITSATVTSKLTSGLKTLWGYNVPMSEEIVLEASPGFLEKILLSEIVFGTPNTDELKNGFAGRIKHLGLPVYLSNGIYNDATYDYCFMRTKKAIAFAEQISKVEPYRPESSFSDAVKGLHLYGAKVVRPKELVVLKASYAAETTI